MNLKTNLKTNLKWLSLVLLIMLTLGIGAAQSLLTLGQAAAPASLAPIKLVRYDYPRLADAPQPTPAPTPAPTPVPVPLTALPTAGTSSLPATPAPQPPTPAATVTTPSPLETVGSSFASANGFSPAIPESESIGTAQALDYFSELAFSEEYRSASFKLHKWQRDIRIRVNGQPTPEDQEALRRVMQDLEGLTPDITLRLVATKPNVEMHFVPEARFGSLEPEYLPTNYGFFRIWGDGAGAITRARILIASEGIAQNERSHLIREELTQSLGLFNDSWEYPSSIFYQGWTATTDYSSLDRTVISWLYRTSLTVGMTPVQAITALGDLPGLSSD